MTRYGIDLVGQRWAAAIAGADGKVESLGGVGRRTGAAERVRAAFLARRLLGRRFEDAELRRPGPWIGPPLLAAENGDAWLEIAGQATSPPAVLAGLLSDVAALATARLGSDTHEAVIAVSPGEGHAARQAVKDAAELGGVRVARLLGAAAAAVIGHGAARRPRARLVVCDLGATRFDASIVAADHGIVETLATAGEAVGGDDFDRRVATRIAAEVRAATGRDLEADVTAWGPFVDEVGRARREAAESGQANVALPGGGDAGSRLLRRLEIEAWTRDFVERLEAPCRAALAGARLAPGEPLELLVVGGGAPPATVTRKLEQTFGVPAARLAQPEELVAHGAAIYAAALDGIVEGLLVIDVSSQPIALRSAATGVQVVVPRFTPLPARGERVVTTLRDGQREIAIDVIEGDGTMLRPLGRYRLSGFAEAPAGEPMFVVDFLVDGDGVVGLAARALGGGPRPTLRREPATGLPRAAVRREQD